ncbi:MAG TPA: efflux RND transporter periplasmic adaptor subunit [Chryseolinea sp.]|nr:efflux RND transporter periplasmic adaptor subunit [Chryseolinea sp.]HPH46473.1 efflux RND transporter periplasmic adaptor subunit [Chryseolinea sp.]HPM30627.1 efflux RND transporter periplasmic adaptor subunit [Chryseolinea sp.]
MTKKILTLFVPLVLGVTLWMCSKQESKETTKPIVDESTISVKLAPVKTGDYSLPIISSGLISTEIESRLSFKTSGIISRIYVTEGQSVSAGQILATLDLTEIDAQVSQSKNSLEKAKRDLGRAQRLYADSAATLEQVQNAETAFNVADESYRIASFNKRYATIQASSNGKVIKKFVNEGELVSGGAPVLMVNSSGKNDWIVKIGLPDVDWVRVKKGDKVEVTTDAYPGVAFDASVNVINEGADPVNGLYQVEVKINPQGKRLASGLFARVEIIPTESQSLKSIPIEALIEGDGKQAFVFVVNQDQKSVLKVKVRIAYLQQREAVISQGLEKVSEVINEGSAFLTEFSAITVSR